MKTAGIIGPYRYHNFGDDLIGLIMAIKLRERGFDQVLMHQISKRNAAIVGATVVPIWKAAMYANVVCIGGGHILGDGGRSPDDFYQKVAFKVAAARFLVRKPTYFCGVGCGPMQLRMARLFARGATRLSKKIHVRDRQSEQHLIENLYVSPDKITAGTDLALQWPECGEFKSAIQSEKGENILGIQLDPPMGTIESGIIPVIKDSISLFSKCIYFSNGGYETKAKDILKVEMESVKYTYMLDFLRSIAMCSVMLTTHLHLAIAAYAVRVPSITMAGNLKTLRFYRQILHPERCLFLNDASGESVKRTIAGIHDLKWSNRDEQIRKSLVSNGSHSLCRFLSAL